MTSGLPKKFRPCGQAESIIAICLGCGGKTRRLTRFNTRGRKRFLIPLQASGKNETRRRLSRSVASMSDVTRILSAIEQGDPHAAEQLLPLVYDELRKLAAQRMTQEKPGQTLQATALVHDAYLRLVGPDDAQKWDSRGHFFAAAAEAMRRILIDNARRKRTEKHGGQRERLDLDAVDIAADAPSEDLLALDEALTKFAAEDPIKAEVVKLRYFAGLSEEEAARALGISRTTAHRHWHYAKVWLFRELRGAEGR
jgi:RNA polymerase sigma factor (TIGR02999 family)